MASSITGLSRVIFAGSHCYWGPRNILPTLKLNESQVRYAARKGYREKKKKAAQSSKLEKKDATSRQSYLLRSKKVQIPKTKRRIDESHLSDPIDNVWIGRYHKWRVYSFEEAVQCHRETHHPTIYNVPDAPLNAYIELDMRAAKKNKYVDNFKQMVQIPHPFDHNEDRSVIVFCKTPELQRMALEAGATLCGGSELIKEIEKGDIVLHDFQFVLAHPEILPELVPLKGLMKRKFPNSKTKTLGGNIPDMVARFKYGIRCSSSSDDFEKDYGWVDVTIGKLDMEVPHLEANFAALIKDIDSIRPKREGPFITRCMLISAPSVEKLKVNLEPYLGDEKEQGTGVVQEEEESEGEDEDEDEKKQKSTKESLKAEEKREASTIAAA